MKKVDSMAGAAYSDLIATRKKQTMTILGQTIALIIILFLYVAKDEVVVVTPSQITGEMVIGNGKANEEYQKRFAYSVGILIGNVGPTNIDFVVSSLDEMLSPNLRANLLPALRNESNVMKVRGIEQDYVIKDMIWSNKSDMVYVWGKKSTRNGNEIVSDDFTYEIRIKPIDGFPRITHLKGYKGAPSKNPNDHIKPTTNFYDGANITVDSEGETVE